MNGKNAGPLKILMVEDDQVDQMAFQRMVKQTELPWEVTLVSSVSKAKQSLETGDYHAVITDYNLEDGNSQEIVESVRRIPVIVITGAGDEEVAVNLMKKGAYDYLVKDDDRTYLKILPTILQNALKDKEKDNRLKILSHAVICATDSIYITDMTDRVLIVNPAFVQLYGIREEEILNQTSDVIWGNPEDNSFMQYTQANNLIEDWKGEFNHRKSDGTLFPVSITRSIIKDENDNGLAIVGIIHDITERKQTEETIKQLAYYDHLTGLPNRILFKDRVQMAISNSIREKDKLAIMILDLDHFKTINDTRGHFVGDKLLQEVAKRLASEIRGGDTVARIGGDEFMFLIMSNVDNESIRHLCERILASLRQPMTLEGEEVKISGSLGISIFPDQGKDLNTLMKNADIAMYQVKKTGRNNFHQFSK